MNESFIWDEKTTVVEKIDGSLVLLYWYDKWRVNTRGSFAESELNFTNRTWSDWIWSLLDSSKVDSLDKNLTYVFEFVSPYNKVVRNYSEPALYLLTIVDKNGNEPTHEEVGNIAAFLSVYRPKIYSLSDAKSITDFLDKNCQDDPTFEGFVVVDRDFKRIKFKSEMYVNLHHLVDNGNLFNPKRLVPLVLNGEIEEVVAYLPEIKPHAENVQSALLVEWEKLLVAWSENKDIESQKEFAIKITSQTQFCSILFGIRKQYGTKQTKENLQEAWRKAGDLIVKKLYG